MNIIFTIIKTAYTCIFWTFNKCSHSYFPVNLFNISQYQIYINDNSEITLTYSLLTLTYLKKGRISRLIAEIARKKKNFLAVYGYKVSAVQFDVNMEKLTFVNKSKFGKIKCILRDNSLKNLHLTCSGWHFFKMCMYIFNTAIFFYNNSFFRIDTL